MLKHLELTNLADSDGPLHLRIARQIREQIHLGDLAPGSKLPKNRDLTKALGVSPVTVQNAIRTLSAEGLVVSRRRVGTFVSEDIPTTIGHVAVVMTQAPHRDDVVLWRYLEAAVQACARRRFEGIVQFYDNLIEKHQSLDGCLDRWSGLDGVLLLSPQLPLLEEIDTLKRSGVRLMVLNAATSSPVVSWVRSDSFGIGYELLSRLYDLGHRRVDFVQLGREGPKLHSTEQEIKGFQEAVRTHSLEGKAAVVDLSDLADILTGKDPPSALIAHIGRTGAERMFESLSALNVRVPEDLSVICFDTCDLETPAGKRVASVDQPLERMADEAMRYLVSTRAGRAQLTIPQTFSEGETIISNKEKCDEEHVNSTGHVDRSGRHYRGPSRNLHAG